MKALGRSIIALLLVEAVVAAQPSSQTSAAAEAQFDKGVELKKAGNWKDACTAFGASQKLDPQFGTLYQMAECNEHLGKLATAWAAYRELAERDTNPKRRDRARDEAHALEPRLSKLVITVTPTVPGVSITLNGGDVTQLAGIEMPVDVGTYELVAKAPGYAPSTSKTNVVDEGKTVTVAIALQPPGREPPRAPPPVAAKTVTPRPPAPPATPPKPSLAPIEADHPHRAHSHRMAYAIGTTSLGGVLVIGGVVVGALAQSKWHSATALCPEQACTSPTDLAQANSLADAARLRGTISDVLFAAGAVAVGAGVYLVVSSRHHRDDRTALRIAPSFGGMTLSGGF